MPSPGPEEALRKPLTLANTAEPRNRRNPIAMTSTTPPEAIHYGLELDALLLSFAKTVDTSNTENLASKLEPEDSADKPKPEDPADKSILEEDDSSAEKGRLVGNKARAVQEEGVEAQQDSLGEQDEQIPIAIKKWIAAQLHDAAVRCYGMFIFPRPIWFMEDWVGERPPFPLLPCTLADEDKSERAEEVRKYIFEKVDGSGTVPS
ncbi:hypothetical protein F4803DRAFT_577080 [Xylaria telfairii]|nr:hypothetical protein F4803DRAFT_577080 [Xylaria telfairii]